MKPLDSDLLRTFLTVARHGSVSRAAQSLYRSQSAISIQIGKLEEQLACPLFLRNARGVSLTDEGRRLCESASLVVGDLDRISQSFRKGPLRGMVRIGIPDEYGSDILPAILSDFAQHHPDVEIEVRCGFSVEFPQAVQEGALDLAVFADPQERSDAILLLEEEIVWVAAPTFQRQSQSYPLPLALFDRACLWREMATSVLEAADIAHRIAFTSESVAGIKAAVKSGLALGTLARSTVDVDMKILGLKEGLPLLPPSSLYLAIAETETPALEAMARAIKRGFSSDDALGQHGPKSSRRRG